MIGSNMLIRNFMRRSLSLLLIAYIASFIGACSTFEEEKVDVPIQEGFNLPEQIYANIEEEHTRVCSSSMFA